MRRTLTILLMLALWGALAGCRKAGRGTESAPGGAQGAAGAPAKLTICVSVPSADHGWTAGVGYWAKKAMAMYPDVEWVYELADNPEDQIKDIRRVVAQRKLDGLVILAHESEPLTPVAKEVRAKGVYIVNVDRGFTEPGVANVFIEGDNESFGRKSAEFVVEKMGGRGKLLIIRGIPCTVDTYRFNAAMEVLRKHPEIEILGTPQFAYYQREKGYEVMQKLLPQFDRIDAVWAQDDDIALGVEQAIRKAGRTDIRWILGGAGMKDIVRRVAEDDPMFPADITYPPSMIAVGIHTCVSNLRDGKLKAVSQFMPRHIKLDVELITPQNAKDHYYSDSVY